MSSKKVALITGGGSGMGLATAKYLAQTDWDISILDLNEQKGSEAAKETSGIFTKTDISSYASQAQAFSNTWKRFGRIDFVFANAGILDITDLYTKQTSLPPPEIDLIAGHVSYDGAIYSSYLALHYFRQNKDPGGDIIVTGSASGLYGGSAVLPIYCSSKYGIIGLVRSLAPQFQKENIKINAILPGAVITNIGLPPALLEIGKVPELPDAIITPLQNIVDAVLELIGDQAAAGVILEVSARKSYRRKPLEYCDKKWQLLWARKTRGRQFAVSPH